VLYLWLRSLGRADQLGTLLFSGVENRTTEANRALEGLAGRVRADPALAEAFASHQADELWAALEALPSGRSFLADLRDFLDRFGHREKVLGVVLEPTWRDAPEVVLGLLQGLSQAESPPRGGQLAWQVARDEVLAHPLLHLSSFRSAFLSLLSVGRCLLQIREDTHFDAMLPLPVLRRTLLEIGRRLVEVGALDTPEDVFHLRAEELDRIGEAWPPPPSLAGPLRSLAGRRKERRAALEGTPLVGTRLLPSAGSEGDVLLRGTSGSPGVAEGAVRVLHDASEFGRLRAGEVLVAPYTNPAWTPLFQRAAAVVADSGGAASHAAIVAREYGIPAVMGTIDATRRLSDGQRVQVDGDRGLVLAVDADRGQSS
jgi:pyruvate,water dikinase